MADSDEFDVQELDPEAVEPGDVSVERLREALQSEDNLRRTHAARLVTQIGQEDLDVLLELTPTLVERLEDERTRVLIEAAGSLATIAREEPEQLESAVDGLMALLDHEIPQVQAAAALAVRPVVVARPEWFLEYVDEALTVMERDVEGPVGTDEIELGEEKQQLEESYEYINNRSENRQFAARTIAGAVLEEIAERDASVVVPHVDRLVDLLDVDDVAVLKSSAVAIGHVAAVDADAVGDAVAPLCALVEHRDESIAANAVVALGRIGDDEAVDALRAVAADEDRDQDLRDLAAETADFLAA